MLQLFVKSRRGTVLNDVFQNETVEQTATNRNSQHITFLICIRGIGVIQALRKIYICYSE